MTNASVLAFVMFALSAPLAVAEVPRMWIPYFEPEIEKSALLKEFNNSGIKGEAEVLSGPLFGSKSSELWAIARRSSNGQIDFLFRKTYQDEKSAQRDFKKLRFLGELAQRGMLSEFKVPKLRKVGDSLIEMDLIEGRRLSELIQSAGTHARAADLFTRYTRAVEEIEKRLRRKFSSYRMEGAFSLEKIREKSQCSDLFTLSEPIKAKVLEAQQEDGLGALYVIRADNVIVDAKTGEMYLFNPL